MLTYAWVEGANGFIDIEGRRLETLTLGPPPQQAPTLVLLHEGLGCVALWRDFPQALAAATGCGVVAYSRFGYGGSDTIRLPRPLDYLTREAADVLPHVLDALGFERGALVGHSDGATIAAIYAGLNDDARVRGLALMAPHVFVEEAGVKGIIETRAAYESGELKTRLARFHSDVEAAFRGWCDTWLNPEFRSWNVAEFVESWRVPALVIQGADDPYGGVAQVREIERRAPALVEALILEDCGHQPQFESRAATLQAIAAFVARRLA